ncbi:MAG: hypothetical protein V1889_01885 [archaeon]
MKKVIVIFLFLFLFSFVSSMNGPIRVMTEPETMVSVFIWTAGGGPLLNSDNGVTDAEGIFTTKTFFSLSAPYKLIVAIKGMSDSFEQEITGTEFDNGMDVDCAVGKCFISASAVVVNNSVEEVVVNKTNESVVNENVSEKVVNESVSEEVVNESVLMTGKALSLEEDDSFGWVFFISGFMVLLFLFVFIFIMFRRRKFGEAVLDKEERELKCVKKEIKETEEKIRRVRQEDVEEIIREAKLRLANEKMELSQLENRRDRMRK